MPFIVLWKLLGTTALKLVPVKLNYTGERYDLSPLDSLPVAMLTTAQALQDALQPSGTTCTSYFVFLVAMACFV